MSERPPAIKFGSPKPIGYLRIQYKPVVATLRLERFDRKELWLVETRVRSGKLSGAVAERFLREVLEQQRRAANIRIAETEWNGLKEVVVKTAERMCAKARYAKGKKPDGEEWWWREEE
jgi:hypothetical protein